MKRESEVVRSKSRIGYSYATIKLTQSRIAKGLIALPATLATWFPDRNAHVRVCFDDSPVCQLKRYSSHTGSTKECRIGGMREWFRKHGLTSGDEIVIQVISEEDSLYRLIPENSFITATQNLQSHFDDSANGREASEKLTSLSDWTNTRKAEVAFAEYQRLAATSLLEDRPSISRKSGRSRETAPPNIRTLLHQLYNGHCQLCDFSFNRKNRKPYFEVHHLDATRGHHPKNLVVVCGNCHNQFDHADVVPEFNGEQWLVGVRFNGVRYRVDQVMPTIRTPAFKELFI